MKKAILITSVHSNAGKTFIATGFCKYFNELQLKVAPFKCGPDYIDSAILSKAANVPAYNLDSVFMNKRALKTLFFNQLHNSDIAVVEGVMGFLDGINSNFEASTFEIAKLLDLSTIFIINPLFSSQSVLLTIKGIETFLKNVNVIGVILNNVSSDKQRLLIMDAIKKYTKIKVLGVIPRLTKSPFSSRHLGLKTALEIDDKLLGEASNIIKTFIKTDEILACANIKITNVTKKAYVKKVKAKGLAYIAYDEAFNFYYTSNFKYLESLGYTIHFFSPLKNEGFIDADLLYIGGGYPELFADVLEKNEKTLESIVVHHDKKKSIIAECGGFMYLSKAIKTETGIYGMCNIFDITFEMNSKRQALGYVDVEFMVDLKGLKKGTKAKGHIYHYSTINYCRESFVLKLSTLSTKEVLYDGVFSNNAFASYTHFHFLSSNNIFKELIT